jgi:Zn-dependent protease
MFRTYRIGSLFGFPLEVNLSFLLMLGAVVLWMGGLAGLLIVLLAFGSVILHELGHALVARYLGVRVVGIELHFFGGAAKMIDQPRRAADEIAIAAAGPAVSFVLGGIATVLAAITGWYLFEGLAWINLIIGAFNLIPALPMDGGRIFRALLTRRTSYLRATEISVWIARGVAIAGGLYALVTAQIFLVLLAGVLWVMGTAELQMARAYGHRFTRDRNGYTTRWRGGSNPEVMPRGFHAEKPRPAGGFRIRQHNGRFYIELID